MNAKNITLFALLIPICPVVTSCGGSGSGNPTTGNTQTAQPLPPASATPGGIWTGADSKTGLAVTVLIGEDGVFDEIRSDNAQFYGTLSFNANSFNARVTGLPQYGTEFSDGSRHGAGTASGAYSPQSQMSVTINFKTDAGTSSTSTLKLSFNSAYLIVPNVQSIAGNYTDQSGVVVTIWSDGTIYAQSPLTGCVVNGNVHPVTGNYSLYAPLISYENCTDASAPLNNLDFDGLMAVVGSTVIVGMHDKVGMGYGLVYILTKE